MLAQSTLRLQPPSGYGQAARLLRGPVDPKLSPAAAPPPVVDEVPVRELDDVTRGLPLSDMTAEQVRSVADAGRPPFSTSQQIRALLTADETPAAVVLEVTRRAMRWAKKKAADAPKPARPAVGTPAAMGLRKSPGGRLLTHDDLRGAAPVVGPPPANNRTVHPFVGTVRFHGLPLIRLENLKGSTRSGTDADGNAWSVTMSAHYGEFARTEGADGDPVDVFVGPNRHAPKAYVIHLQDPVTGEHDEDKCFVGFDSADDARSCFRAAYNRDDLQMGPVRSMTTSELAEWLAERDNRGRKIETGALLSKAVQENDMSLSKGKHFLDEDLAQKAHAKVAEQYGLGEKDGERYWKLKTAIYQQMGGTFEKSQSDEAADLLRSAGGLPTSQTYGTPAKVEKPAAAAPPPAPPPVARPHHHQDPMQLPTKPTKKFPPPSHPKPTRAPLKLMSTPGEMMKARRGAEVPEWLAMWLAQPGALSKSVGHKYVRRVPKPGGGYRYFYTQASATRGATAGESVRLGGRMVNVGSVTATHVTVDGESLTHDQWLDKLSEHYSDFEANAAKRAGVYARAVLRHLPPDVLASKDPGPIYDRVRGAFDRTGMTSDSAQRAITWVLSRRGWGADASAAMIGEMTVGQRAKWVQDNYRRVGAAAESLRADKAAPVRAVHVSQAVDSIAPAVAKTERPHAELLADAMSESFPGMKMEDLVRMIQAVRAKESAAKAPPKTDGDAASVYLPGEGGRPEKIPARFKLVEADDLIASHDPTNFAPRKAYPAGLQERAYHRDKAEQLKVVRNAAGLIPEYVANTNPDAVNGTPLVDSRGVVLGGNSRTMSMQLAYKEGNGARLKAHLAQNAGQFGLDAKDVNAMKNPVLVRVVDTQGRDPNLLVRQMNESMTQDMDPRVMQVAMGRKLDDDAIGKMAESMGTDQTLSEFLDSPRSESFVGDLRRVGIIDARNQSRYMRDGRLNADGKQLVERVLVGKVVGDPDLLSDTSPSVVTALAQAVPYMVQAEAHGSGYNLREDLRAALHAHNDIQRRGLGPKSSKDAGRSVDDYLRHTTMFGGDDGALAPGDNPITGNARATTLAKVLFAKTGPRQLASVFRTYAEQAQHNPEGQFSLFGAPKSPLEVLAESVEMAKSMRWSDGALLKAQRHEADALLKAAGGEPPPAKRPAAPKSAAKPTQSPDLARLADHHEKIGKMHAKAYEEAANAGDGELAKKHTDAEMAHREAVTAARGGGGPATSAASQKAKDATEATLPKADAGKGSPAGKASEGKPAAAVPAAGGAQAQGVGGRSKEGLKVIAIGPRGGKIVGYTTKDGKQKAIYEGSQAAAKLAATVATHAEPAKAEPGAKDAAAPAAAAGDAAPDTSAAEAPAGEKPDGKETTSETPAASQPDEPDAPNADPSAGDQGAAPAPATPSEPIDDKPLSPDEPAGGTPSNAPDPEDLGSASPKTDSPESRHAEEIAKMRAQVEDAHKKLAALAHHIDTNLVPMFNNLKSQARAAHRNPNPSVVGWLLAQIGRFASFVLGLHEDKGKVTSAADAIGAGAKDEGKKKPAETKAAEPAPKAKPPQARVIEKSLTASGAAGLEGACVDLLSTLQAIERLEHSAHLQAQGPEFYADHLLFGRLYEGVQDEIDGLSEKMVAAFGPGVVDADARAADAAELLARWEAGDGDALGRALAAELDLQAAIAGALAADGLSPGLENFLQGLADSHETAIYLLQQRLRPAVAKSLRATTSRQAYEAAALLKSANALG